MAAAAAALIRVERYNRGVRDRREGVAASTKWRSRHTRRILRACAGKATTVVAGSPRGAAAKLLEQCAREGAAREVGKQCLATERRHTSTHLPLRDARRDRQRAAARQARPPYPAAPGNTPRQSSPCRARRRATVESPRAHRSSAISPARHSDAADDFHDDAGKLARPRCTRTTLPRAQCRRLRRPVVECRVTQQPEALRARWAWEPLRNGAVEENIAHRTSCSVPKFSRRIAGKRPKSFIFKDTQKTIAFRVDNFVRKSVKSAGEYIAARQSALCERSPTAQNHYSFSMG